MVEDTLRRELEASFRNRADLYSLMHAELTEELGPQRGKAFFKAHGPSALAVGAAFLAVSPDGGRMYPTDVTRDADGIDFRLRRFPLKDAWHAAGLDDATAAG